jgi:hypothetical protein
VSGGAPGWDELWSSLRALATHRARAVEGSVLSVCARGVAPQFI